MWNLLLAYVWRVLETYNSFRIMHSMNMYNQKKKNSNIRKINAFLKVLFRG